jgi:hypothetical protein
VLKEKTDIWHHSVSPPSRQQRLESLTDASRSVADADLGAASILANLHHRRIIPLMERELRIFEMNERLLHERFPPEYAATRARRAISVTSMPHSNNDLWSFIMLLEAPVVSGPPFFSQPLAAHRRSLNGYH